MVAAPAPTDLERMSIPRRRPKSRSAEIEKDKKAPPSGKLRRCGRAVLCRLGGGARGDRQSEQDAEQGEVQEPAHGYLLGQRVASRWSRVARL